MSEYQYVAFRAIDGPVSDKNLEFMHRQSSRAQITPWSFQNEYHYGDFNGNADEMLRRGYDLHLHYANFGIRKLMIRLPRGLPDSDAVKPFLGEDSPSFVRDKGGPAGILIIDPYHEAGELKDLFDIDELVDRLVPLRAEILDGDLRPFYLANLAMATDDQHYPEETIEAPVPAGLKKLSDAQEALAELYGLSNALISAAARNSPPLPASSDAGHQYAEWLEQQPQATKHAWLAQLMADPHAAVRRAILAEFQKGKKVSSWPTVRLGRTIAALESAAEEIQRGADSKAVAKAARDRAKKLAAMAADPLRTIGETEKLVMTRGKNAYRDIATLLADLREALAGTEQSGLAELQARKLKNAHPTLHSLTGELRRHGFLPKGGAP